MCRLLIALCLLAQLRAAPAVRLYPVDDTNRDSSFRSFVKKFRAAVEARDTRALRKLTDPKVVIGSKADDAGWDKFEDYWRPEDPDTRLWGALSDLLLSGFIREHPALFVSPYLVWRFPRELSMARHLVVIRDKAPLRTEPAVRAPLAASLSFDIVERLGRPERGEDAIQWVHVRTMEGQTGYLNMRDAMSPLMPRAQFGLQRGRWLMMALEGSN